MNINATDWFHMLMLDVVFLVLLLSTLAVLYFPVCEDSSTGLFILKASDVQFISTRIMQCKYNLSNWLAAVPWLFATLAPCTAIVFAATFRTLAPEQVNINNVLSSGAVLVVTIGAILLVRFDENNLQGRYGSLHFAGYAYEPKIFHVTGVAMLILGIFVLNVASLVRLAFIQRGAKPVVAPLVWALVVEFEYFEVVYCIVVFFFFLLWFVRQYSAAAVFEYMLMAVVFVLLIINRQLYYAFSTDHVFWRPSLPTIALDFRKGIHGI